MGRLLQALLHALHHDVPMYFDADYRETVTLRDGTLATLRQVRPDDKDLLRQGFLRMSPESRYKRFFTPKETLSDEELRYLTDVDGVRHFALGALREHDGHTEGLGVARFIVVKGEEGAADCAEAAIAVIDEMQGKGLGSLLFQRLIAAARERGVRRFRCEVLGSNRPMQDFLRQLSDKVRIRAEDGIVSFEVDLPDIAPTNPPEAPPRANPLYELLKAIAGGEISWERAQSQISRELSRMWKK